MTQAIRGLGWQVAAAILPLVAGCLNPEFLNQTTGGLYPTAPGDEPFISVRVINDTSADLDIAIVYDDGTQPTYNYFIRKLTPEGRDTGILLEWPILRVAVGDLNNPFLPLTIAYYPDGTTTGVFFGHPALQANVDYQRGDTIIFHFVEDSRSPAYVRVDPGLISGASEQGTFTRDDPFEHLRLLMEANGF